MVAVAWLTACTSLFDLGRIAAIDVLDGIAVTLEEGESRRLRARAVTAAGDTVPDATIHWERVDVDSGVTSFTIDTVGNVTALAPGAGSVVASVEEVRTGPITITITAQPDLVLAADSLRVTLATTDTVSAALSVRVVDVTTTPNDTLALPGKLVQYAVVDPGGTLDIALTLPDSSPGSDPGLASAFTNTGGIAAAVVLRQSTTLDSAVIQVIALTATGDTVSGSPVRFVVIFEQ